MCKPKMISKHMSKTPLPLFVLLVSIYLRGSSTAPTVQLTGQPESR